MVIECKRIYFFILTYPHHTTNIISNKHQHLFCYKMNILTSHTSKTHIKALLSKNLKKNNFPYSESNQIASLFKHQAQGLLHPPGVMELMCHHHRSVISDVQVDIAW